MPTACRIFAILQLSPVGTVLSRLPVYMQTESLLHRIEVPIRMEQFVVIHDAERADDDISRLANSDSATPQPAVVIGRRKRHLSPNEIGIRNICKEVAGASIIGISSESLQDLSKDEIAYQDAT